MDVREQIANRVKALVTDDENFISKFFSRHRDLEQEFYVEARQGTVHFDDWLETVIEIAQADYAAYGQEHPEATGAPRIEKGKIEPRRSHKGRRNATGASPWARQRAQGDYLSRFAGEHPDIRRFRSKILGGRLLDAEEAREFIRSPLAASRRYFYAQSGGRGALLRPLSVEDYEDGKGAYRRVVVQGKSKPRTIKLRPLAWTPLPSMVNPLPLYPGDVLDAREAALMRTDWGTLPANSFLFPHPADPDCYVVARERSVLAELADISGSRLEGYPINPKKGAWFILTGDFISSDPVQIAYTGIEQDGDINAPGFKRSTIVVEVESWMPPEEVAEHYRHAQRAVVGKSPRSLDGKSLAVFEFVNRNRREDKEKNKKKTWEALLREWNRTHPAQRFGQRRHLYQAYQRAQRKIAALDDYA